METTAPGPDLAAIQADVQGNILRAYGTTYPFVRHLVASVVNPQEARAALGAMVSGERSTPEITPGNVRPRTNDYGWCLNVGMTYAGLQALGLPPSSLSSFPPEFREGMVARAARLGDVGPSDPKTWRAGLGDAKQVHLIFTVHGRTKEDLDEVSGPVLGARGGRAFRLLNSRPEDHLEGEMIIKVDEDTNRKTCFVHFDFADGISQPRFEGIHEKGQPVARLPYAPLGAVLLGYPTALPQVMWRVPEPKKELGTNGTYNAFRVLRQDVRAFEEYIQRKAETLAKGLVPKATPELVAAKLVGRWRNGTPLTLEPDEAASQTFDHHQDNNFDYEPKDPDGWRCPIGAHIRRCNPRGAHIVQRAANRTRPIMRRGIPYGPPFDPTKADDNTPRGLLGNFICSSLAAQFEAMQYDWINLGLQHPAITGTHDPLTGSNDGTTSRFVWPRAGKEPIVLDGLPRFVTTEGGAYCFLPSISAIGWIASLR